MTTAKSSPAKIHAQAVQIAKHMKAAPPDSKPVCKVGIAMDDKVITFELPWSDIAAATEAQLVVQLCRVMRVEPDPVLPKRNLN